MTRSSHMQPRKWPGTRRRGGAADGGSDLPGTLLILLSCLLAGSAVASDIVTWTDDQGVVHFGNARLGPTAARRVDVAPANGMDKPEVPAARDAANGPAMILIEREPNRETIGWRGHDWNVKRRGHR